MRSHIEQVEKELFEAAEYELPIRVISVLHGCLGVTNAQESWLAQVGRGVLIGQERTHLSLHAHACKACRLLSCGLTEANE